MNAVVIRVLLGWVLGRFASRKPIQFRSPCKVCCEPGVILPLRPGSDVSILLRWGLRRALLLVRVVVTVLLRDAA